MRLPEYIYPLPFLLTISYFSPGIKSLIQYMPEYSDKTSEGCLPTLDLHIREAPSLCLYFPILYIPAFIIPSPQPEHITVRTQPLGPTFPTTCLSLLRTHCASLAISFTIIWVVPTTESKGGCGARVICSFSLKHHSSVLGNS